MRRPYTEDGLKQPAGMRSLRAARLVVMWGLALLGRPAGAQTLAEVPAKVELISEWDSVPPGHQPHLSAGLLFKMDPGWHIYWKNPGDSGEPPKIQWTLPEGFRAGTIEWPTPKRLGHGSVVDYGYEGQVLLMTDIANPVEGDAIKRREVLLMADVKYLVCREICIPAKAHLALTVPVGASTPKGGPESPELFHATRAHLPKPQRMLPDVSVESNGDHFVLSAGRVGKVQTAAFFPEDPDVVENSAPQTLTETPNGFRLTLKKSELLTSRPEKLRGVLVLDGDRAYEIAAPIAWR